MSSIDRAFIALFMFIILSGDIWIGLVADEHDRRITILEKGIDATISAALRGTQQ